MMMDEKSEIFRAHAIEMLRVGLSDNIPCWPLGSTVVLKLQLVESSPGGLVMLYSTASWAPSMKILC
jgi:hypothetical protein